jgi:hypothetical protein
MKVKIVRKLILTPEEVVLNAEILSRFRNRSNIGKVVKTPIREGDPTFEKDLVEFAERYLETIQRMRE